MIFVDSNIVIDLIEDGTWTEWSKRGPAERDMPLVANPIVLAEVARAFATSASAEIFFSELGVSILPITPEAAFDAGRAHVRYRIAGGWQDSILADFLIGAHAAKLGATLVTRDRGRFATYFPDLTLITPETHP